MNVNFWQNKRVFITGHTGFKGSWLTLWLNRMGAKVAGLSLLPATSPSLYDLAGIEKISVSSIGDIRDRSVVDQAIKDFNPEIVFHLAAQPLVRESYQFPVETYATNVMGTAHVFDAIRRVKSIKAFVNITTDKVYENREWSWGYREVDTFGGYDPYSNSKACSELVTAAFRSSFFNPVEYSRHGVAIASARAGNVIGGGDWAADRIVPDCFRALAKNQEIVLRNPHAIRPWQHVLEPLRGYLCLAEKLFTDGIQYAEGWNFGPTDADCVPVESLVKLLCAQWGSGAAYRIEGDGGPHEASFLKLDCSKAFARLGWKPVWNLETTIGRIVEWNQAYNSGADVKKICEEQIAVFEKSI